MADKGLKRSTNNDHQTWNMIVEGEINAELLVAGSSRAMRLIDPKILEDKTGLDSYNLGMEGARLRSQLARWDSYLAYNKPPRVIIQTVDLMSMGHAETVFKKQQYLPFLSDNNIYDHLKLVDNRLFLDRYFPLYKYHGYMDEFKEGLRLYAGQSPSIKHTEYKGFEAKDKSWNREFKQMTDTLKRGYLLHPDELIEEGFEILDDMIKDCRKRNIQLVLVFTPQYSGFTDLQVQTDSLVMGFEQLGKESNVHFINYVYDPICSDTTYFYNAMHLNRKGATVFTEQLAKDLMTKGILD